MFKIVSTYISDLVYFGSMATEDFNDVIEAHLRGYPKRGGPVCPRRVTRGTGSQQELHHFLVTVLGSNEYGSCFVLKIKKGQF